MDKKIRKIDLKGKKIALEIVTDGRRKGYASVVKKNTRELTNQVPHVNLIVALERMAPHLLIACDFTDNTDDNGNFLQGSHFDEMWWTKDERYSGVNLTGVHVATKNDQTAIYLIGYRVTSRDGRVDLKTPIISFIKTETSADYPFIDIIKKQFETLWFEIEEFIKGKTGDEQIELELNNTPAKKITETEPVLS